MSKVTVKISSKKAASTRHHKVWNLALPVDYVENTLGYVPRLSMRVEDGDLIIVLSKETGALMNRPTTGHTLYYSPISQKNLSGMGVPFDTALPYPAEAKVLRDGNLKIKNEDLPPMMQLAIRQFKDLVEEVKSHQPEHSTEEFQKLVKSHKGGETIGDHEALEKAFSADDGVAGREWTDRKVRDLKAALESMLKSRPDIKMSVETDGQVKLIKTVQEEI